jgi:hypothetical protein
MQEAWESEALGVLELLEALLDVALLSLHICHLSSQLHELLCHLLLLVVIWNHTYPVHLSKALFLPLCCLWP